MFQSYTVQEKIKEYKPVHQAPSLDVDDQHALVKLLERNIKDYFALFVDLNSAKTMLAKTIHSFKIEGINKNGIDSFVNIRRINDVRYLNKFFEAVNKELPAGGNFILCAEIKGQRKKRILNKYPKIISYPYYTLDFIVKRIFPKWKPTKKLYFFLTKGNNRVISMPEILGRLVSCGFKIVHHKEINNLTYFAAKKDTLPIYEYNSSYGLLFKMKRIGIDGKSIFVHKLRTMHPYAEYLQNYIYTTNSLDITGKIKNDYRITHWGKIFRKLWIDELPMLYNWFKGDLKLVGLRPLSAHYLSLYDSDFRDRRIKYKPGLIPPYYVDLPKSLEEIISSEKKYLDNYEKNPFKTDLKYFFKVGYQIFIKGVRSS